MKRLITSLFCAVLAQVGLAQVQVSANSISFLTPAINRGTFAFVSYYTFMNPPLILFAESESRLIGSGSGQGVEAARFSLVAFAPHTQGLVQTTMVWRVEHEISATVTIGPNLGDPASSFVASACYNLADSATVTDPLGLGLTGGYSSNSWSELVTLTLPLQQEGSWDVARFTIDSDMLHVQLLATQGGAGSLSSFAESSWKATLVSVE